MTYTLTIFDVADFSTPAWVLKYSPGETQAFTTIVGTEHVWLWDFVSGALLKDGAELTGHTIEISIA